MALGYAFGAMQWTSATGAGSTLAAITGLSFVPEAFKFITFGMGSSISAQSATTNHHRSGAFATSASQRRCVASYDQDAANSMICATAYRDDCIAMTVTAGTVDGRLDLNSTASDGFQCIVDDASPADITVFWEAWGNSGTPDLTVAVVGDITEPAATGTVDYTVNGFVAGATDQSVQFFGCQAAAASPTAGRQDSGWMMGFATANGQIVHVDNSDDAVGTSEVFEYWQSGECLAMIVVGSGNPDARAAWTQFGTNNFRLNWIARAVTGRRYIFLALKGGQWAAGQSTINLTGAVGTTSTVSGLAFQPQGINALFNLDVALAAGTANGDSQWAYGMATSTSNRQMMWEYNDQNGTCNLSMAIDYSSLFVSTLVGSATVDGVIDLDAITSDGFRIIITNDFSVGASTAWWGYFVWASNAAGGGGRTTKNTRSHPLGTEIGMGWRMECGAAA